MLCAPYQGRRGAGDRAPVRGAGSYDAAGPLFSRFAGEVDPLALWTVSRRAQGPATRLLSEETLESRSLSASDAWPFRRALRLLSDILTIARAESAIPRSRPSATSPIRAAIRRVPSIAALSAAAHDGLHVPRARASVARRLALRIRARRLCCVSLRLRQRLWLAASHCCALLDASFALRVDPDSAGAMPCAWSRC